MLPGAGFSCTQVHALTFQSGCSREYTEAPGKPGPERDLVPLVTAACAPGCVWLGVWTRSALSNQSLKVNKPVQGRRLCVVPAGGPEAALRQSLVRFRARETDVGDRRGRGRSAATWRHLRLRPRGSVPVSQTGVPPGSRRAGDRLRNGQRGAQDARRCHCRVTPARGWHRDRRLLGPGVSPASPEARPPVPGSG